MQQDTTAAKTAAPYTGLRVLEISETPAGDFLGMQLAEMGAEVIKLEPPGGSPARAIGPFAGGSADPERSLNFWYYNASKKSVVADIATPAGRDVLHALLGGADVFICTFGPAALAAHRLDLLALTRDHPRLIVTALTDFGLDGPWAAYKSSDLVGLALGGPLNSCGYDDHSIPPIRPGGNQAYHTLMSFGYIGLLLALLDRQRTGRGQLIDVAMHDSCAVNVELANPYWFYPRVNVQRQTCRHAQPVRTQSALFAAADGRYVYCALILSDQHAWKALVKWMAEKGIAAGLDDPAYLDFKYRQQRFPEIQAIVECFFLIMTAHEAYDEGQKRGMPIGVVNSPEDLLEDEHFHARGFFVPVRHADGSEALYPGPGYRFSSFDALPRKRAPLLGEHVAAWGDRAR